jgi:hypothetical protein
MMESQSMSEMLFFVKWSLVYPHDKQIIHIFSGKAAFENCFLPERARFFNERGRHFRQQETNDGGGGA